MSRSTVQHSTAQHSTAQYSRHSAYEPYPRNSDGCFGDIGGYDYHSVSWRRREKRTETETETEEISSM